MGIPVEYSFHEDAPGQQEIDLRHTDALTMADSMMTFRLVVREVAARDNVHATFMPKPLEGVQGSGMHVHLSLFRGDENAFHDGDDPYGLSDVAKSFMAGLLRHAAEITAVTNQTVNSYKRLVPGFEAPVHVSWARNNRSGLIRVPIPKRGNPLATRIEYRSADPACNPYLAFSLMLAAGMRGVEEGYELPDEADANLFEIGDEVLEKLGVKQIPQSLAEALAVDGAIHARPGGARRAHLRVVPPQQAQRMARLQDPRQCVRARSIPDGPLMPVAVAQMLVVVPDPASPDLARTLDLAGYSWKAVAAGAAVAESEPQGGWAGAIVDATSDPEGAWSFLRAMRKHADASTPVMLLIGGAQLAELEHRDDLFDDFCLTPFHPAELEARMRHLLAADIDVQRADLVEYAELTLNLETYQASIAGRPLDMTYMEYELLKFLAQNPGKVFTREILLSRVWGYEYYGGARTVDVHIRRLRAKLGEEHANLIQTVRSVGYRFGQSRWDS